jgi:pimeloyl-ACP methyl ester carboxylesterase
MASRAAGTEVDTLPERPANEGLAFAAFRRLAPRLRRIEQPDPPPELAPWESVRIERPGRAGALCGTWYPASEPARGAVLLLAPWIEWGRAYFHRRGRIEALREVGYHALTFDFPGFGGSGPVAGFYDRDAEDALRWLARRAPGLALHVWGVSSGGYWMHPALARDPLPGRVAGAMFEEVSPHLLEWSCLVNPWARPGVALYRALFPAAARFLDLRRHAPRMRARRIAYVSGAQDPGLRPADTRDLAERAAGRVGARVWIVPAARHLEGIKVATDEVIRIALDTFHSAEQAAPPPELA